MPFCFFLHPMGMRSLLSVVAVFLLAGAWGPMALSQERPTLPSQQHATLQPTSALPAQSLPPVDVAQLRAKDKKQEDRITPYRYGTVVDTDYRPDQDGTWEQLPSNDWVWRLRIQSQNAVSLSLGFSRFELPEDASLYMYGPQGNLIRGPYTQADATNGEHWTPLVRGEEVILELKVPAHERQALNLVIGSVVHGYRSLSQKHNSASSKSGTCNIDVACDEADSWREQVRAVGGYTVTRNNDALLCSGSLINNTAQDGRPLFLTAEHCVSRPSTVSNMVFYWNFQTSQCRTPGSDENGTFTLSVENWSQTSTGATLLARYGSVHETGGISGKPDLTLVEVDDKIPKDYDLYLSGWDREDTPTTNNTTIHHPRGHGKRISLDKDPSSITGYLDNNGGDTHLRIGNWEKGTTEKGSSGSPLFNSNQEIVGVLSGGGAGCISGTAEDNDEPDWYGRLADGFNEGDYQGRLLSDFLDPEDTGAQSLSGQHLTAPPAVSELKVVDVTSNSAILRWKTPESKNASSNPTEFDLRVRPNLSIETSDEFEQARRIEDVPSPGSPGTTHKDTVELNPGKSYYFAIRTLDAGKNASSIVTAEEDATPVSTLQVKQAPSPNPTGSKATVKVSVENSQTVKMTVYDILGRRVGISKSRELTPFRLQKIPIDVSSLSSGVYFVRIKGRSTTRTEKIIVKR
jgi:lysyl endopeptidase